MSEVREVFEQSVKASPSYQKLIFIHGERLFIIEDGQYKIAAIQLAWEIYQGQENRIDDIRNQNQLYMSERGALIMKERVMAKHWQKMKGEKADLQKRIDAALEQLERFNCEGLLDALDCAEQALRGES